MVVEVAIAIGPVKNIKQPIVKSQLPIIPMAVEHATSLMESFLL
jgi:hypothetical protein